MSVFEGFEIAYAKINLALHVRQRRADGYHEIETLFVFAGDGDVLSVAPASGLTLSIIGPFSQNLSTGEDNLVLRAAYALQRAYQIKQGAALTLDKRLPVAAGIGGGSADAAAALRLLMRHWNIGADPSVLFDIAKALGADVPACVHSHAVRGEGVGDQLHPVDETSLKGLPILLVNPKLACPTGAVFEAWDRVDRGALSYGDALVTALAGRNDLETPALGIVPLIGTVCDFLKAQKGVILTRMSGSGATCFALFENREQRDQALANCPPDWWSMASHLR